MKRMTVRCENPECRFVGQHRVANDPGQVIGNGVRSHGNVRCVCGWEPRPEEVRWSPTTDDYVDGSMLCDRTHVDVEWLDGLIADNKRLRTEPPRCDRTHVEPGDFHIANFTPGVERAMEVAAVWCRVVNDRVTLELIEKAMEGAEISDV